MDGGNEGEKNLKKKNVKKKMGAGFLADVLAPCGCLCECVSVFVHDPLQSRCSPVFDSDNESFLFSSLL